MPVGVLAQELGRSRRHLAASFREQLGMPPKALARLLRFERAVERLRGGADLAELALDCGYYDQAHFNRDFKAVRRADSDRVPGHIRPRHLGDGRLASGP